MAQVCEVCGKKGTLGNHVTTRGRAKYLGGVGTKVTGITRRKFKANLQNIRVTTPNGTNKSIRICTQCIRSGVVTKTIHSAPFKLPQGETTAKPEEQAAATPKSQSVKSRKRQKAKEEKASREKK